MASGGSGSYNTIKVVARFRPQNSIEIREGGQPIVQFHSEDTCELTSKEASGSFTFDRVFDMASKQADVFNFSIKPTVDDILNGYNGTVFAYGQTGAGKSYTMMGADIDNDAHKGVIPRIVEQIFYCITNSPQSMEYTVRVSYMEIYMERIRDLLNPINDNLPVHEDKGRGVYVKGLLELYVSSVQEVYEVMRRGGAARSVSATNMNQESSRSHSIFVISVSQKNVETGSTKNGNLYLVDLAGSEKVGKTGASGQTLEEAKKINKSLSTLGMVINNLTDGSKYIPYRDSKLTRILQESLGGNSRTTLIINCSPSSYNDSETLSTLRFGMRAKSIKNKAKVNTELSPAELKALLKKSQTLNLGFQEYLTSLEQEVIIWRNGDVVPQEKWAAPTVKVEGMKTSASQRPGTPSAGRPLSEALPSTPRPDSRIDLRSSTPLIPLDKDEKEEFLRRENELQDQLADRESQLSVAEKALKDAKEELAFLKEHDTKTVKNNEKLTRDVNELRMQLEKISFESKEAQITMDGLKEANLELTTELSEVKQHLADVKMATKETSTMIDEKEKKKAEKMAKMMAGFDLGVEVFSDNEKRIRQVIERVDQLTENNSEGIDISLDDLKTLRTQLVETQGIVRQAELSLNQRSEQEAAAAKRRGELEARLLAIEREYQELLDKSLGESDSAELKERLEKAFNNKRDVELKVLEELKLELTKKSEENEKLKSSVEDLERRAKVNEAGALPNGKTIAQQIAEFDVMKKSLMRDLQNRCERVVELEISLDETREQYNNVLRSSNNRAQQKKMAFLERNLEQLTHVQRQLVEQNNTLKKEVAIAEKKLSARNERIVSLESLLQESQEKLTAANHRFEAQLTAVKERLEAVKAGSRGMQPALFSFAGASSRIAKPLRGGGGDAGVVNGNAPAILSGTQGSSAQAEAQQKRTSWFFNQR
ncbi:kinesin heavy chain [Terfezia boudieri ATCC MYA-4762]|uniref:Kinesin heavy chain n=1 Tax=Terfezia boudieri ATCC MYA-4762 TaxID=1051890 RepID=A0A3N4LCG9_9PEZI|nr:kinesin heavy chain [Terfezia boudieri ATCC MYA-4762]